METTKILHIDARKPVVVEKSKLAHLPDDFIFVMDSIRLPGAFNVIIDCKYIARNYSANDAMVFNVATHFHIISDNTELFSDSEQKNKCSLLDNILLTAIAHCRMNQVIESHKYPMNETGSLGYISLEEAKLKTIDLYEERI